MPFEATNLQGLWVYTPNVFEDSRGYFFESFNNAVFKKQEINSDFVQDNQSSSLYGVIRGLHYQLPPFAQTKLVRVLRGKILDVVVDLRKGSPTYAQVYNEVLSAKNKKQLYIPPGFAHGFSVLSKKAEVLYKCDAFYNKESEAGIRYDDPVLKINWKIPSGKEIVSAKDIQLPYFENCNNSFVFES